MRKSVVVFILSSFLLFLGAQTVTATSIWFDPVEQFFNVGDTVELDLKADIDTDDAIMGFGFDLSFDEGTSYVAGPGASGDALKFDSFTANNALGFSYDALYDSDGDTINGFVGFYDPDVFGNDLTLGTFSFTAFDLKSETIMLSADDYGSYDSEEGLVPGFTATNTNSILPNGGASASVSPAPVPEPATFMLIGTGLLGIGFFRKKVLNNKA